MADINVEEVLAELSLDEKITLTAGMIYPVSQPHALTLLSTGRDFWHTNPIPRMGLPAIRFSDGPNGVRGTRFFNSVPAACLPCATALGATWDVTLMKAVGQLIGREAKAKGAHVVLGPTINLQRSPLGGRGFESFAEDPFLSGILAAAYCNGLQGEGIVATLKHFVCNDLEDQRKAVNVIVSDRALREIYLMPFMLAIRDSKPGVVMTAYNKLNGIHCSENGRLLKDILRKEWGFEGAVISDWFVILWRFSCL
jgi:beta-glucosidase